MNVILVFGWLLGQIIKHNIVTPTSTLMYTVFVKKHAVNVERASVMTTGKRNSSHFIVMGLNRVSGSNLDHGTNLSTATLPIRLERSISVRKPVAHAPIAVRTTPGPSCMMVSTDPASG